MCEVRVTGGTLPQEEINAYIDRAREKYRRARFSVPGSFSRPDDLISSVISTLPPEFTKILPSFPLSFPGLFPRKNRGVFRPGLVFCKVRSNRLIFKNVQRIEQREAGKPCEKLSKMCIEYLFIMDV